MRTHDECEHGEWLPWLEKNADALGFENITVIPQRLMKVAKANSTSTLNIDDPATALAINRKLHGNSVKPFKEWYTPLRYIEAARD